MFDVDGIWSSDKKMKIVQRASALAEAKFV